MSEDRTGSFWEMVWMVDRWRPSQFQRSGIARKCWNDVVRKEARNLLPIARDRRNEWWLSFNILSLIVSRNNNLSVHWQVFWVTLLTVLVDRTHFITQAASSGSRGWAWSPQVFSVYIFGHHPAPSNSKFATAVLSGLSNQARKSDQPKFHHFTRYQ